MLADNIRLLFDYGFWARERLTESAATLDASAFAAPYAHGLPSIRGMFTHLYVAELLWRTRFLGGATPSHIPTEAEFPTLESLLERAKPEEAALREYLSTLTDGQLAADVHYRNTRGEPFSQPLGQLLLHLANHGTQHRSELALRLTEHGHSPGDLDLTVYLRHR